MTKMPEVNAGELVTIDAPDFPAAAADYLAAQAAASAANDRAEAARARLELLIGDHTVAEGGGYRVYYRFTAPRKTLDAKALTKAHPEINLDNYQKEGNPSRRLQIFTLAANLDDPKF